MVLLRESLAEPVDHFPGLRRFYAKSSSLQAEKVSCCPDCMLKLTGNSWLSKAGVGKSLQGAQNVQENNVQNI